MPGPGGMQGSLGRALFQHCSFRTLESRSAAVAAMTFAKGADLDPISAAV
jgi:hypothetical protein